MSENRDDGAVAGSLVVGHKRDGRCVYDRRAKRALVESCLRPGASVARIAMTHGVNANVLRRWIIEYRGRQEPAASSGSPAVPALVPVTMIDAAQSAAAPNRSAEPEPCIEITLGAATIRLRGAIDAQRLCIVLDCLARS